MEDQDLVINALQGGPASFRPIVDRYQRAVFGVALSRLRDFHGAEDVAQQVFLDAFERLPSLRDPSRLGPWLRSVTVHRCIDLLRARRESVDLAALEEPASGEASALERLERDELRAQVLEAVSRLSPAHRETVTLYYLGGHSVQEIAAVQEVPEGTVKRRLHDARGKLKEEMLAMVETTLPTQAPGEGFGRRVFDVLCQYGKPELTWPWTDVTDQLRRIGGEGVEGFVRAMETPHGPTRLFAVHMVHAVHETAATGADARERLLGVLLQAMGDRNKRVRASSASVVLHLDVPAETRRRRVVPALVALLRDPTWRVRRRAAYELWSCPADVPLDEAALALADERHPLARGCLVELVRLVVAARKEKSGTEAEPTA